MLKLAVLVSGGGTNLQAIIDSIADGRITGAKIQAVISNNKNAYALTRAEKAGIPARCISPRDYKDRTAFEDALLEALIESEADLVVLAGCLVVIPEKIVDKFENRIINIHPSLIPSFCGKDYYGLKVHESVLERGVKVTGATVHFVDKGRYRADYPAKGSERTAERYASDTSKARHGRGRVGDHAQSH